MLLLGWMLACSHVYMLEGKRERVRRGRLRQRERLLGIVPTMAADVKMLTDLREIFTHHEICITQDNY